jgi:thiol:disulfide interchange protein DsbD
MPPTPVEFDFTGCRVGTDNLPTAVVAEEKQVEEQVVEEEQAAVVPEDTLDLWRPVDVGVSVDAGVDMWYLLLGGFVGGLLALLTPCVWPMIPMTLSYFLKRSGSRCRVGTHFLPTGVVSALTFGASIVVIYVALGCGITALLGASALNELSTSAVVNVFFALLLVVFAASFLGAFELVLPASWSTKAGGWSERAGGIVGIFLMAFVLVLTSFSCTGPIIGFLLVEAGATGGVLAPMVGMLGFGLGLAVPFALFALSPGMLKRLPKSGGWMVEVKVVLAVVELAFALKFLSVADLAYGWGLLSRELFLAVWIVLALSLGVYLLVHKFGVWRLLLAAVCFGFAVYQGTGFWGAPLRAVSAFVPPRAAGMGEGRVEARFTDYEEGMAFARAAERPVLLDFTGFGCVNCRRMEQGVWLDAEVARLLTEEYVLISLYVDSRQPIERQVVREADGQQRTLRTVGDRWSYLQRHKFGANAQPFYVAVDGSGNALGGYCAFEEDAAKFAAFLRRGLKAFHAK